MTGQDLKNSILQLAIQGKLVPQDANDEPASVLLERIKAEKKKLIEEKKIKKEKPLAEITEDEIPFEIPENWVWVRLGEIISISSGDGLVSNKMITGDIPVYGGNGITGYHNQANVFESTIVIGRVGYYYGSVHETPSKAWVTDNAFITQYPTLYINRYYLIYMLRFMDLGKQHNATAQPVVSGKKIYPLLIPLPPLSEQRRIVAKIEELMPLIDEYDKAQKELDALNSAMPEQLKQSLLQEAIMGKLGTNNPDDEPASELLKRIGEEKAQLIKEKKIKKEKPLPEITEEEMPFEIPENWEWVRLGEVISISSGDGLVSNKMIAGDIPVYGGNGITGYHNQANVFESTIVIGRVGYYCGSVHETPSKAWVTDNAFITQYPTLYINRYYLIYMLRFMDLGKQHNATAQPVVSGKKICPLLIPLPPLAEQHRIIEKLDALLPMISELAKSK